MRFIKIMFNILEREVIFSNIRSLDFSDSIDITAYFAFLNIIFIK